MFFKQVKGRGNNFSYVVADENTREAAIVDPDFNSDELQAILSAENLKLLFIIDTHDHIDHVIGDDELKVRFGGKIVAHKLSKTVTDVKVDEGDVIQVGSVSLKVLHTPGHSVDSICLLVNGEILLTGDTLMLGSVGQTGMSGGDEKSLYDSVFKKILTLEDDIEIFPGHDRNGKMSSTLGEEKRTNKVLKARSFEEFSELIKTK